MGRPTDLTPELQAKFVDLVRKGNYPCTVAKLCSIDASTYKRWMRRGRNGEEPFGTFRALVRSAEAESEIYLESLLAKASEEPRNWKAAEFLISRRHRKNWSAPANDQPANDNRRRMQYPKLTDSEFWDRYEAETKELAERLEILAERRRLLAESKASLPAASNSEDLNEPNGSPEGDLDLCKVDRG